MVVTVFDDRAALAELLDALALQTRPPDEVVVVDAGSPDGTRELLEERGQTMPLACSRSPARTSRRAKPGDNRGIARLDRGYGCGLSAGSALARRDRCSACRRRVRGRLLPRGRERMRSSVLSPMRSIRRAEDLSARRPLSAPGSGRSESASTSLPRRPHDGVHPRGVGARRRLPGGALRRGGRGLQPRGRRHRCVQPTCDGRGR